MRFSKVVFFLAVAFTAVPTLCTKVVPMNIVQRSSEGHTDLADRSIISHNTFISSGGETWVAEVQIGTPPQSVHLQLDTSTGDTFVLDDNPDNECHSDTYSCWGDHAFNPANSTTYHELDPTGFHIGHMSGPSFEDNFRIGGIEITAVHAGLQLNNTLQLDNTECNGGLLGLGYDSFENNHIYVDKSPYPSFMDKLVSQELINTPLYSMSLDDLNSSSGRILFGGIDKDRFVGEMLSTPIMPRVLRTNPIGSLFQSPIVSLSHFGLNGTGNTFLGISASLTTRYTLTYMPRDIVEPIIRAYGGRVGREYYIVNCSLPLEHPDDYLVFQFGSDPDRKTVSGHGVPTVRVPISEMVLHTSEADIHPGECKFGLADSEMSVNKNNATYLGNTFLRSAYTVYDLKNNEVGFAQAYYNSTTSSIVEVTANATAIPVLCGRNGSCTPSVISAFFKHHILGIGLWILAFLAAVLVGVLVFLWLSPRCIWWSRAPYQAVPSPSEDGELDEEGGIRLEEFI